MNSELVKKQLADILIVDDNQNNLRLLSEILSHQGYKVRSVTNGHSALKAALFLPPDLILLDINMPQINGYETCKQLKASEKTKEIPVIFLSALNEVLDKVKAFQVGGVDYITKPFQIEEVLVRVENQLRWQHSQKLLTEKNLLLEKEISDRVKTEALLKTQTQRLEQTLNELKQTQVQLIQNEKMLGLAQLVAGIAHEINNPVTFIYSNIEHATKYVQDLLKLLDIYQQEYPQDNVKIHKEADDIDLDFIIKDLQKLMESMRLGAKRIQAIVLALRIFSRLDEAEMKSVNIHENIDSTLVLLQHRLTATKKCLAIEIIKKYGDLPQVTCYPSQLNQVFFHLLTNALDALDMGSGEAGIGETAYPPSAVPTIWIYTELTASNSVKIRVIDNGPGIPETLLARLFEPFFTTKQIGSGKGLGLSISYQIVVEKHQGQLTCSSSPGQGAEFAIEIPVQPPLLEK